MKRIFVLISVLLFISISCISNVRNVDNSENINDGSQVADNSQNDKKQNDDDVADNEIQNDAPDEILTESEVNEFPDEDTAGIECLNNDDCLENEFCSKESCDSTEKGQCSLKRDNCYMERVISPVCGCDNYTYASTCWAERVGVNVQHDGECEGDVMCWNNEACKTDEYCEKKIGVCEMSSGVCRKKPADKDCPPAQVYHPFCGCDLYEYDDICYSAGGGIPVKHMGKCNGPDDSKFHYFFGADAQSPDGNLKIVMSETYIRKFICSELHTENVDNTGNYITITINFKNETEHARLQFTVLMSDVTSDIFPFGMGLGYHESYLKVFDSSENVLAEMQGTVMIYDYSPLFMSSQIPTLDVRGLNLWVKE